MPLKNNFNRLLLLCTLSMLIIPGSFAQKKKKNQPPAQTTAPAATPAPTATPPGPPKNGPKPFKDVITAKAKSAPGLFTVHKVEEKYFFEIPDSVFGREIMTVTRFSKIAGGGQVYGGELANQPAVIKFEKGPDNKVFMRVITTISVANDSTEPIYKAVRNSNLDPIAASFDVKSPGRDSTGAVIDVSDFFKGDNLPVSLSSGTKRQLNLGGLMGDRSFVESIKTFPMNTEIRTVKTFSSSPSASPFGGSSFPFPARSLPAASAAGSVTLETNTSFIILPVMPMRKRPSDARVGFFSDEYVVYSDQQQKVEESNFIVRWRLEPKPEDMEKWKRGELVEPAKPIIYYIDPATPKKWRPYLIQGVNDWQAAFEKAGFKNAIIGKDWPENDSSMSLEDARFSVIRYFASDITNAYGPNVHDPRSGEIIESHIGWYHNVMKLVHDWYFVQAAAVDPAARKMTFDDELMGQLIRFVSSHEVGHTLGLRHNMGSSSKTPVEKLRDKSWVEANGHTASIMDYARFNYVAQPEDNISRAGLFPRIGDYDKWAIEWGYGYAAGKDEEEEKKILSRKFEERYAQNPRIWFGTYENGNLSDPRTQSEDLGDNSMKASEYGIKNLKRIVPNLPAWTKETASNYDNLQSMYSAVQGQFNRYMGHVARNIGGYYETYRSVDQTGDVFEMVPRSTQKEAVQFLQKQFFETPTWLLDRGILNKLSSPASDPFSGLQDNMMGSLLSTSRLSRMVAMNNRFENAYTIDDYFNDLKKGVWTELPARSTINQYRRNLQKHYTERMIGLLNPSSGGSLSAGSGITITFGPDASRTDIVSVAKAHLTQLRSEILAAIPSYKDNMSRYHLQDMADRIKNALNPKG
jgi:hypothetical protein